LPLRIAYHVELHKVELTLAPMMEDPFEQFERSRGGLLIPVLLFLVGMVPTAMAIRAMGDLESGEGDAAEFVAIDRENETGQNPVAETPVETDPDTQEDAVP
jgi:hypothetical protein